MTAKIGMVTFDAANASALAAFWAKVLDGKLTDEADGWFATVDSPGNVSLGFQKVPDPTPGKNKIHLDISEEDYAAGQERLKALGAKWVTEQKMPFGTWTTFADPEGNLFCLGDMSSFNM